jgi:hypothetical protein
MRRRSSNFADHGYGPDENLGPRQIEELLGEHDDSESPWDEEWHYTVLEDHLLWREYGCPIDIQEELPRPMVEAHLAIIAGQGLRKQEEKSESDKEAKRARRQANTRRHGG